MGMNYVPLRCRSNFSFLHGPVALDRLLEAGKNLGHKALGLADINGLYGAVQFYAKAKEQAIKPIIGCELETEIGTCVFYAMNMTGYGNVCRLSTIKMLHQPTVSMDDIARHAAGIMLVYMGKKELRQLKDIFGEQIPSPIYWY